MIASLIHAPQDKLYACGEGPDYDRSCWNDVKEKLDFDFPNLPYYMDGRVSITQSNAILRYIAAQHGLIGTTEAEQANCMEMQDVAMDFRNAAVRLFYNRRNYEEAKSKYLSSYLPTTLKRFETRLSKHAWFCGENLTFVDFVLYELIDQVGFRFHTHRDTPDAYTLLACTIGCQLCIGLSEGSSFPSSLQSA